MQKHLSSDKRVSSTIFTTDHNHDDTDGSSWSALVTAANDKAAEFHQSETLELEDSDVFEMCVQ